MEKANKQGKRHDWTDGKDFCVKYGSSKVYFWNNIEPALHVVDWTTTARQREATVEEYRTAMYNIANGETYAV